MFGFSKTLTRAKQAEEKLIQQNGRQTLILMDEGSALAMRALGWGTLYAVLGVGSFCYGIWKLSGATNVNILQLEIKKRFSFSFSSLVDGRISYEDGSKVTTFDQR